ncbi:MAG: MmcQ/YjbR family DNA-binding protein [Chitinophagales bacterium]|nr:MmcQ/YjbR family DNA-binding protein [Chitinophagales bacterium]
MPNIEEFRTMCLSLPASEEHMHFDKPSFRVNKKIFATLWLEEKLAVIKLTPEQQNSYCEQFAYFYPVKGKWGEKGWTHIDLHTAHKKICMEALTEAWNSLHKKKS